MLSYFKQLKSNYSLLRKAVNVIGEEFEAKSVEDLNKLLDNEHAAHSFSREFEGVSLDFDFQDWGPDKKTGCPGFSVNVYGLPTLLGVKPGYHFYKREDGTVFY